MDQESGFAFDIAWMAWTWPTGIFFLSVAVMFLAMSIWQRVSPSVERVGILRIATTRGDRLFIALLGSAYIHLAWLGLTQIELYWASGLALIYAVAVFRWV